MGVTLPLTVGSLFSGIGGLELGLERTGGFRTVWQVERDEFARRVLAKHWPDVRRHDDVRTFPPGDGDAAGWRCDVICGGFPCQDISVAGRGAGIGGERSGLWAEFARIVRLLRPRLVLVENVPALLGRGLGTVLGDLAACGYDAEWDCIPAAAVGAPHLRDRVFVVAHAHGERREEFDPPALAARAGFAGRVFAPSAAVPDPEGDGRGARREGGTAGAGPGQEDAADVADPPGGAGGEDGADLPGACERDVPCAAGGRGARGSRGGGGPDGGWWGAEPAVGRVADGVPDRVDRLRCLGNAVVPQVAEFIGRRLLASLEGGGS
jgi:DNA (cytosine-5)-methyltransferase 1